MIKHLTGCLLLLLLMATDIRAQESQQLHETARTFMRQGDYSNAILVLNQAVESDPQNLALTKDLALSYYFHNDINKALEVIKPAIESDNADDQIFLVAGTIYKRLNQTGEAEKLYKKGIKKYPENGAFYNELGELLWNQKDYTAIRQWEKGIREDPSYSRNYYNAAKYYFLTTDRVWGLIYGEIFLNMEPFGDKAPEIKDLLLESYKKLFIDTKSLISKENNSFENNYLQSLLNQVQLTENGITAESLTMIRTRFILEWFNDKKHSSLMLFDFQRQLLQDGLFNAYNQWIFGSSQNLTAFQNWITSHPDEYAAFTAFQKTRIFKVPTGQYYND